MTPFFFLRITLFMVYNRQSKLGIDAQNYANGVVYNENGAAAVPG